MAKLLSFIHTENAGGEDAGAEAAAMLEEMLGAGSEGTVHPVTGTAFGRAEKADALELKLGSHELVEVEALGNDVAAGVAGGFAGEMEFGTKGIENLAGEEGDLALVIRLEIEETVAADAAPGDALDLLHLQGGMFAGRLLVVAEKIVAGRDVEAPNLHNPMIALIHKGIKPDSLSNYKYNGAREHEKSGGQA
jgi:hypothetical protein